MSLLSGLLIHSLEYLYAICFHFVAIDNLQNLLSSMYDFHGVQSSLPPLQKKNPLTKEVSIFSDCKIFFSCEEITWLDLLSYKRS